MNDPFDQPLLERARRIRLFVMDVDGVLTNGQLLFTPDGHELKSFHVHDGLGLALLRETGIQIAVISGHASISVQMRAERLSIQHVIQNVKHKGIAIKKLQSDLSVLQEECAFVGDDLIDLPAFKRVGLTIAVANAVPEVKDQAHWVTQATGGNGAIRECVELLLKAQGIWPDIVSKYLSGKET